MKNRMIAAAFGLLALVQVVEAVLCAIVWRQFNLTGSLDSGEMIDVAPFPGGFTTMRGLWYAGIVLAVLALLLVALPPRPMLAFLGIASGAFGGYGLWVTEARPTFAGKSTAVLGANEGFPEATILYVVAAGLAVLAILLTRPLSGGRRDYSA